MVRALAEPPGDTNTMSSLNPLPSERGPISRWLFARLRGEANRSRPRIDVPDALVDDDLHVSLHTLFDLGYRPFDDVDAGRERDVRVMELRNELEDLFWTAVRNECCDAGGDRWTELARTEGPRSAAEMMLAAFDGPSLSTFVEHDATEQQFREFLIHRSAYQLKEADPHTMGLARLRPGIRKSAVASIQFDEYGEGRAGRSHAELFAAALREAGLDDGYGHYVDVLPGPTLATGNLLSLFAGRREFVAHLVGHLALFEMTSVTPMSRYSRAAARLGFGAAVQGFYDVHVVADTHHGQLGRRVLLGDGRHDDELDPYELVLGAHALLRVEDRFTRSVLACWSRGESSLRYAERVSTGRI